MGLDHISKLIAMLFPQQARVVEAHFVDFFCDGDVGESREHAFQLLSCCAQYRLQGPLIRIELQGRQFRSGFDQLGAAAIDKRMMVRRRMRAGGQSDGCCQEAQQY